MGEASLGFRPDEIGTHSIRSGGAMAYYLVPNIKESTIMFIGRWKSNAFLAYIRDQVDKFRTGLTTHIVSNPHFHNIPSLSPAQAQLISSNRPHDYILFGGELCTDDWLRK